MEIKKKRNFKNVIDLDKKPIFRSQIETRSSSKSIKKQKERIKDYQISKNKIVNFINVSSGYQSIGVKLYGDIVITMDGSIRLSCSQGHVSFGYQRLIGEIVQLNKQTNCINISQFQENNMPQCTLEQAIDLANRLPGGNIFSALFQELSYRIEQFQNEIQQQQISDQFQQQREEQFIEFSNYCFEQIKNLSTQQDAKQPSDDFNCNISSNNNQKQLYEPNESIFDFLLSNNQTYIESIFQQFRPSGISTDSIEKNQSQSMFIYYIGRFDWRKQDMQMLHTGYSKEYLELIGLDNDSLISLVLRQKRIDLMRDNIEISNFSAYWLLNRMTVNTSNSYATNIVTFDGFPIKIYSKTIKKQLPSQFQGKLKWKAEYLFGITYVDVDIHDLQNLIRYRQQLANKSNSLSMDHFIEKELSYRFEDIEYSIHSESFIDKYYQQNVIALKELEKQKQSEMRAKYQLLKQKQHFNPIQVQSNLQNFSSELNCENNQVSLASITSFKPFFSIKMNNQLVQ